MPLVAVIVITMLAGARLVHFPAAHAQLLPLLVREETLPAGCAVQLASWSVSEVSTPETQQMGAVSREDRLVIITVKDFKAAC